MDKKKRNTLLLMAVLVIIIGAAALLQKGMEKKEEETGMVAVIEQEGKPLERIPLDKEQEFVIEYPAGGYNTVSVKDGKIRVTEADCPDLTCVRTGEAFMDGQVIACLPHRLIIYVEAEE